MIAYILIQVPPRQSRAVIEKLRQFSGVVEASAVYGEVDIVAKVQVPDNQALDHVVMDQIQEIPEVNSTLTLIGIESLSWKR